MLLVITSCHTKLDVNCIIIFYPTCFKLCIVLFKTKTNSDIYRYGPMLPNVYSIFIFLANYCQDVNICHCSLFLVWTYCASRKRVMLATCMKPELPLTSIRTDLMCFIPLPRNSQEEVIFERQLVRFSSDLQIPITRESSAEDIEFISSYLTFIKFARIFLPEPGSCLSSLLYKSGAPDSPTFHVLYFISLDIS